MTPLCFSATNLCIIYQHYQPKAILNEMHLISAMFFVVIDPGYKCAVGEVVAIGGSKWRWMRVVKKVRGGKEGTCRSWSVAARWQLLFRNESHTGCVILVIAQLFADVNSSSTVVPIAV